MAEHDGHPPLRLDLEELERLVERDGFLAPGLARDAITELRRRRADAERDLRFMQQQIAERTSLKYRITALRRGLKNLKIATGQRWAEAIDGELDGDDATRRRFEAKERRARRG